MEQASIHTLSHRLIVVCMENVIGQSVCVCCLFGREIYALIHFTRFEINVVFGQMEGIRARMPARTHILILNSANEPRWEQNKQIWNRSGIYTRTNTYTLIHINTQYNRALARAHARTLEHRLYGAGILLFHLFLRITNEVIDRAAQHSIRTLRLFIFQMESNRCYIRCVCVYCVCVVCSMALICRFVCAVPIRLFLW